MTKLEDMSQFVPTPKSAHKHRNPDVVPECIADTRCVRAVVGETGMCARHLVLEGRNART